jgi:hypothetical protein
MINKGETLEDIENAARLIKKNNLLLSLCFIIGLPGDNLERIKDSIKFAKKFKPDTIYWNMIIPYRNTQVRDWFIKNGKVYNEIGTTSLADGDFKCEEPVAETPDFTSWERKKAHYMCLFQTTDERLKLRKISGIFREARKYDELKDFISWLPRGILKSFSKKVELLDKFAAYIKREGFIPAFKRAVFLIKEKGI